MNLNDLYDKKCRIDKEQRDLNDVVEARDGVYTDEEEAKWDAMNVDFDKVNSEIRDLEKQEEDRAAKAKMLADRGDLSMPEKSEEVREEQPAKEEATLPQLEVGERYENAFAEYRKVHPHLATPEYADAFRSYLAMEKRALQADLDTSGGFVATPEKFVADLIKDKDRMVFIRQFGKVISLPKDGSVQTRTIRLSN